MNNFLKQGLQRLGIYHPLQSGYRALIRWRDRQMYRRKYRPYAGSGFTCNVCGAEYSRFVPDHPATENRAALEKNHVMAGYGNNIVCPNCLSTARERLVIGCLEQFVHPRGKSILHLSPEPNVYAYLKKISRVVTADLHPGFYRHIDPAINQQDATSLTYPDQSFDLVIANHVLEHIPDDRKAMHEFFRILTAGGRAVLQVPYSTSIQHTIEEPEISDPVRQSALFGQNDHVRIYALTDYMERLERVGFEVSLLPESDMQSLQKYAIQPGEVFLMIQKPR